jgi:hypothetical protein
MCGKSCTPLESWASASDSLGPRQQGVMPSETFVRSVLHVVVPQGTVGDEPSTTMPVSLGT